MGVPVFNEQDFQPLKARKEHFCSQCGQSIERGNVYYRNLRLPSRPIYCDQCKKDATSSWEGDWTGKSGSSHDIWSWNEPREDENSVFGMVAMGVFFTGIISSIMGIVIRILGDFEEGHGYTGLGNGYMSIGFAIFFAGLAGFLIDSYVKRPISANSFTNIRNAPCLYHQDHINATWCIQCYAPICTECAQNFKGLLENIGPLCPRCKQKRNLFSTLIGLCFATPLAFIGLLLILFTDYVPLGLYMVLFSATITFCLCWYYRDLKKPYNKWMMALTARESLQTPSKQSFSKGERTVCAYHTGKMSYFRCEKCGKAICTSCMNRFIRKISHNESETEYLCLNCYWPNRRKAIFESLIFTNYLFTPLIISLIVFFASGNVAGFVDVAEMIGLLYLLSVMTYQVLFLRLKRRYSAWKEEVGLDSSSENNSLELNREIPHVFTFLLIANTGIIIFLVGIFSVLLNLPGINLIYQWMIVVGLLITFSVTLRLARLNTRVPGPSEPISDDLEHVKMILKDWVKAGSLLALMGLIFFMLTRFIGVFANLFIIGFALIFGAISIVLLSGFVIALKEKKGEREYKLVIFTLVGALYLIVGFANFVIMMALFVYSTEMELAISLGFFSLLFIFLPACVIFLIGVLVLKSKYGYSIVFGVRD